MDILGFEFIVGGNGNDVIIGSEYDDLIETGSHLAFWEPYGAETRAAHGGFTDTVVGGAGNDEITTMMYCTALVDAGPDDDAVYVLGIRDVVTTGEGIDMVRLAGGSCEADLGAGDDYFVMSRASVDDPSVSHVILGSGADNLIFDTGRWLSTPGNDQALSDAPWFLDFDPAIDKIVEIDVWNRDELSKSLDPRYIYAVNIDGGSALIYDHPIQDDTDFCFARFAGVTAAALQANVEAHSDFTL